MHLRLPRSTPSIAHNIASNYVAQAYTMVVGIVTAPLYLRYMGTEAYGLIGFFTMITVWFQLLDMGLTPTLMREVARYRGGAISSAMLRSYLRALELIFGAVSLTGGLAMALSAEWVATHWLHVKGLSTNEVAHAVLLMGLAVPLRWMSGLHRGAVAGFEHQIRLSGFTVAIATLRFLGVLPVLALLGTTPTLFFGYQFAVAALELAGLVFMTHSFLSGDGGASEAFSWKPFFTNLRFSLIIAFTAAVWVVITQTDKLMLSKLLPLAQYGMFSIAIVASNAVNAASGPLSQALLPRMSKLVAQKDEAGLTRIYGSATQLACVLVTPAVALLCFFAEPILRAWTGKPGLALYAAPILRYYAVGNGLLVINAFAYYMQYARGDLRLHVIGNTISLVCLPPLFYIGARHYGGTGTALAWFLFNAAYALFWVPVIHAHVFKGQHWYWLLRSIVPIVAPTAVAGWAFALLFAVPAGRFAALTFLAGIGLILLAAAISCSSVTREWLAAKWVAYRQS